jgi:opacity protein-like surface antigen
MVNHCGEQGRNMRTVVSIGWSIVIVVTSALACWAEDSDRIRVYLGLRGQDTNRWTHVHDLFGFSLGINLNRYVGIELSGDRFERFPQVPPFGSIGEYGVFALVPQVRLRYPLLNAKLTPYAVGGIGVGLTQFNDRKPAGFGLAVQDEASTLVGTLGMGLEYFVADNIAVGIELKYLLAEEQTLRVNGEPHALNVDSLFTSVAMRLFVPELRPRPPAEARDPVPTRVYFGVRLGGALSTNSEAFAGVEIEPVPPAYGGQVNQFFGVAVGVNSGHYFGLELAAEGYEVVLAIPGIGHIGEYTVLSAIPQLRLRYPLLDGRLIPYAIGGVSYAEFNDPKPPAANLDIDGRSFGVAASGGAGIEYFAASNIAVGFETKYLTSLGHTLKIDTDRKRGGILGAIVFSIGLRIFLAEFTR